MARCPAANLTLTVAALALLSASCVSVRTTDLRTLTEPLPPNVRVLSLVKDSGEVVLFSKSDPGRLSGYRIVGLARERESKPVDLAGPFQIKKDAKGRIFEVTDGKGGVYTVERVLSQDGDRMTILASLWTPISVPLAEVRTIEVRKVNALKAAAYVSGGILAIVILPVILTFIF
jgi:hypothetical protein